MTPERVSEVVDSLERIIVCARVVDFDLLNARQEAIAKLMIEARFFGALCSDDLEPFDTSELVMEAMRKRRGCHGRN